MKSKIPVMVFGMMVVCAGMSYAAEDQASLGTEAAQQSLGGQAGTAARDLKSKADESLSTGAMKVAESSRKVEAEVRDTVKTLQQQWDEFSKQFQEKTRQLQKQLEQQWQDFSKSFNASQSQQS